MHEDDDAGGVRRDYQFALEPHAASGYFNDAPDFILVLHKSRAFTHQMETSPQPHQFPIRKFVQAAQRHAFRQYE